MNTSIHTSVSGRTLLIALSLSATLFLFASAHAHAHGSGGWIEEYTDDYILDFDYSITPLESNTPMRLDFNMRDIETGENVPFTNVWVSLTSGNNALFEGNLQKAEFGLTGMGFTFSNPGQHELHLRFEENGNIIAESPFSFSVVPGTGGGNNASGIGIFLIGIVGMIAGVIIGPLFRRG